MAHKCLNANFDSQLDKSTKRWPPRCLTLRLCSGPVKKYAGFYIASSKQSPDSDIRIVHWVKKRVVGAAPGSNNNMSIVSKIIRVL